MKKNELETGKVYRHTLTSKYTSRVNAVRVVSLGNFKTRERSLDEDWTFTEPDGAVITVPNTIWPTYNHTATVLVDVLDPNTLEPQRRTLVRVSNLTHELPVENIEIPKLIGARASAADLVEHLDADENNHCILIADASKTESAAQGFADELVKQVLVEHRAEHFVVRDATPRFAGWLRESADRRDVGRRLCVINRDEDASA